MPEIGREDHLGAAGEVVCAVKFASWTEEGRLRAPVFLGLRLDVEPKECVRGDRHVTETKPNPRRAALGCSSAIGRSSCDH